MEKLRYNPEIRGSGKYWATLGAFVLAVDALNDETLTNGFARGREHENKLIRVATIGTAALTFAHLMDWLPDPDPIDRLANGLSTVCDKIEEWTTRGVHLP